MTFATSNGFTSNTADKFILFIIFIGLVYILVVIHNLILNVDNRI